MINGAEQYRMISDLSLMERFCDTVPTALISQISGALSMYNSTAEQEKLYNLWLGSFTVYMHYSF